MCSEERDRRVYVYARVDSTNEISYSNERIFKRAASRPGTAVSEIVGRHSSSGVVFNTTSMGSPVTNLFPSPSSKASR